MEKTSRQITSVKTISIIIAITLLASIVPLLYIGLYDYPSSDDFTYSHQTHQIWQDTHSIKLTLKAAAETSLQYYNEWQGTYSACSLMALQPGIFNLYSITPFILIFTLISGTFGLLYIILIKYLNSNLWQYLAISSSMTLLSLQFIKSPVEAFFWYNGSIYYTFYFSISLFLYYILLIYIKSSNKKKKIQYGILCCLLALFIAGGNFVIGLTTFLILCSISIILYYLKKRIPITVIFISIVFLAGFIISIAAPGNNMRAATITTETPSAIYAIYLSLIKGAQLIFRWSKPTIILVFIVISIIMIPIIKKTNFSYPHPIWVTLSSYAIFCSLFTPSYYAMGISGWDRTINMCQYYFYWFVLFNLFYHIGHLLKKPVAYNRLLPFIIKIKQIQAFFDKHSILALTMIIILFLSTIIQPRSTTYKTMKDLISGDVLQYAQDMEYRQKKYNSDETDLILSPLSAKPETLFHDDIFPDKEHWVNKSIATYFNKNSIILKE